jgi:hypothetical protein
MLLSPTLLRTSLQALRRREPAERDLDSEYFRRPTSGPY